MSNDCHSKDEDTSLFGLPTAAVAGIASGCAALIIIVVFFCCKARSKKKREEREYEYYTAATDPQPAKAPCSHERKDSFGSFIDLPQAPSWSTTLPDVSQTPLPSNQPYHPQPPLPPQLPGRSEFPPRSHPADYAATSQNSLRSSRTSSSSYDPTLRPSTKLKSGKTNTKPGSGALQPSRGPDSSGLLATPGLQGSSSSPFFSALKRGKKLLAPSSPTNSKQNFGLGSPGGTAPPPYSDGAASPVLLQSKKKHRLWTFGGSAGAASPTGPETPNRPSTVSGTNASGAAYWYSNPAVTPRTFVSNESESPKGKGRQPDTTFGPPTITVTHPSRGNSLASTRYPASGPSFATGSATSGNIAETSFGGGSSWQGAGTSYGPATTVGAGSSWHPGADSAFQGSSHYVPTVHTSSTFKRAYQLAGPSTAGGASTSYRRRAGEGAASSSGGSSTFKPYPQNVNSPHSGGGGAAAPSSFGGSSWQGRPAKGAPSTFYTGGSSWQGTGTSFAGVPNSSSFGPKVSTQGRSASDVESTTSSKKRSGKRFVDHL